MTDCICRNGIVDDTIPCYDMIREVCTDCNKFFHLNNNMCLKNKCECINGYSPDDCTVHNDHECSECYSFYTMVNGKCIFDVNKFQNYIITFVVILGLIAFCKIFIRWIRSK